MILTIVPVYSACLALMFIFISFRVIIIRRRAGIALGTRRDIRLLRAARVQANFAEYVPLALILLSFVEMQAPPKFVHTLALALIAGRICHAYGVSREPEDFRYRITGTAITFTVLAGSAMLIFAAAASRLA